MFNLKEAVRVPRPGRFSFPEINSLGEASHVHLPETPQQVSLLNSPIDDPVDATYADFPDIHQQFSFPSMKKLKETTRITQTLSFSGSNELKNASHVHLPETPQQLSFPSNSKVKDASTQVDFPEMLLLHSTCMNSRFLSFFQNHKDLYYL